MKFLRDYDEALDTSVMSILEQNFAEGVRSCNQTKSDDQEPVTSIPGNSTLFPEISQADSDDKNTPILTKKWLIPVSQKPGCAEISLNDWESVGLADAADKYLLGISHYARRMVSIIPRGNSWAQSGATFAADISDAVFSRISILRDTKPTKQVKQRALVDLFKCLKEQGYSSMKWSVPSSVRDPHQMLQLPVPSTEHISSGGQSISTTLEKGESYFHRCQVEISRLRFEVSMLGSQYMSQREMTLMQGYSEYVLFMLCQQRSMLAIMLQSVGDIESFLQSYDDISDSMPSEQTKLSTDVVSFENSLFSLIESLHELVLLIKESSSLVTNEKDRETVRDSVAVLMGCVSKLEQKYVPCAGKMPITSDRIDLVSSVMSQVLIEVTDDLLSCAKSCDRIFPSTIFGSCLDHLNDACALSASIKEDTSRSDSTDVLNHDIRDTMQLTSSLIQSTLISAQSICTKAENEKESSSIAPSSICTSHSKMIEEWDNLQLEKLKWDLNKLSNALVRLHNDGLTNKSVCSLCTMTITNSFTLVRQILHTSKSRMVDALSFYHQHSKMLYILLRVFRNLIAKGFCSDDVADGGEGDGEGGAGEMKFEDDVEGTGMGEGDGKEDVTDQIENEEQLLGLKGDEQETSQSQERKELDKEEVDTGMEMEADFEGEKYDLPEQQDENKNDNESENEEELDREMGDGNDPNEQVVDEKMWDKDEDDLEDLKIGRASCRERV